MKPVVNEPADTEPVAPADEPVVMGEVKPEPPAEEPTPPADTTPPTVTEVAWYHDWQMTEPVVDDIRPGDTIYTVVTFSEAMQHTVAGDGTARPALFIVVDGVETRYRMAAHGASGEDFTSGTAKPLHGGTDDYLCKYTIPADTVGTIALRVEAESADVAGNMVAEESEYAAPFAVAKPTPVTKPEPRPSNPIELGEVPLVEVGSEYTFTFENGETYPGYNPSPGLQHILDTHPSAQLPFFEEAVKMVEVIDWVYLRSGEMYFPDWERIVTARRQVEAQFGLTKVVENTLHAMYVRFLGYEPNSTYWSRVEQIRILLQNPEPLKTEMTAKGMADIQRRFGESLEEGLIVGETNPNN